MLEIIYKLCTMEYIHVHRSSLFPSLPGTVTIHGLGKYKRLNDTIATLYCRTGNFVTSIERTKAHHRTTAK
jgi:hypothetical protein